MLSNDAPMFCFYVCSVYQEDGTPLLHVEVFMACTWIHLVAILTVFVYKPGNREISQISKSAMLMKKKVARLWG